MFAQESSDLGVFGGMSEEHQQTILPVPELVSLAPAFGAFYRYNLNKRYAFRVGANYGVSPLADPLDVHTLFEFNFLPFDPEKETQKVTTFIAAGIGAFFKDFSTPGVGVNLQPNISLPFVTGVKYQVSESIGLAFEWHLRKTSDINYPVSITNTDKNPSNWYSFVGLTAHYNFKPRCKDCPYYDNQRKKKK